MILNVYLLLSVCFSNYFWVTGFFWGRWGPASLKTTPVYSKANKVTTAWYRLERWAVGAGLVFRFRGELKCPRQTTDPSKVQATPHR